MHILWMWFSGIFAIISNVIIIGNLYTQRVYKGLIFFNRNQLQGFIMYFNPANPWEQRENRLQY